mgnify:CR=1 FL=1
MPNPLLEHLEKRNPLLLRAWLAHSALTLWRVAVLVFGTSSTKIQLGQHADQAEGGDK